MKKKTLLGRCTNVPRGDFSETETYVWLDLVYHEGSSYLCIADSVTGVLPPDDSTKWMKMAEKGATAWSQMTEEEKEDASNRLGDKVFGFKPVFVTQNEFDNLGDRIDASTMYYIIED